MSTAYEKCPHCGQKVIAGAMRCPRCGKAVRTEERKPSALSVETLESRLHHTAGDSKGHYTDRSDISDGHYVPTARAVSGGEMPLIRQLAGALRAKRDLMAAEIKRGQAALLRMENEKRGLPGNAVSPDKACLSRRLAGGLQAKMHSMAAGGGVEPAARPKPVKKKHNCMCVIIVLVIILWYSGALYPLQGLFVSIRDHALQFIKGLLAK